MATLWPHGIMVRTFDGFSFGYADMNVMSQQSKIVGKAQQSEIEHQIRQCSNSLGMKNDLAPPWTTHLTHCITRLKMYRTPQPKSIDLVFNALCA